MTIHRQVLYSGRVQGVGFRYSVKQIAAGYEVTGWVRNRPDGSVELQVSGEEPEVKNFLSAVEMSHLGGHIHETVHHELDAPRGGTKGFEIRH